MLDRNVRGIGIALCLLTLVLSLSGCGSLKDDTLLIANAVITEIDTAKQTITVKDDADESTLCLAYFHIVWKQEGCYYCSEFVGELLTKSRVDGTEQLRSSIIQPMQFLRMPHTLLYCGKLREYVSNTCSEGICEDATNRTVHRRLP